MTKFFLGSIATAAVGLFEVTAAARAADVVPVMPIKAPAELAFASGVYVWADHTWDSIHLPTFALGLRTYETGNFDRGPKDRLDPHPTGQGTRGAVGYIFPYGTFSSVFGSNVRMEVGGSYVRADDNQSQVTVPTTLIGLQLLSGGFSFPFSLLCSGGFACSTSAALSTNYQTWQFDGKVASDFRPAAAVILTPSMALFGGVGRVNQSLVQYASQTITGNTLFYSASSSLHWINVGAKVGLDSKFDLTSWLAAGLGGSIGFAHRDAWLSASDSATSVSGGVLATGASSIGSSVTTTAILANLEANLTAKPVPNTMIRTFIGLNYDDRVPGISPPSFTGASQAATSTTGAGIKFEHETSWYAGVRAMIQFAPWRT